MKTVQFVKFFFCFRVFCASFYFLLNWQRKNRERKTKYFYCNYCLFSQISNSKTSQHLVIK